MKSKLTVYKNGAKYWKLPNGNYHREDGPAIENSDGYKCWYLNGVNYTEQEYKYKTRSKKLKQLLQ
jgi:hypothetical protein